MGWTETMKPRTTRMRDLIVVEIEIEVEFVLLP